MITTHAFMGNEDRFSQTGANLGNSMTAGNSVKPIDNIDVNAIANFAMVGGKMNSPLPELLTKVDGTATTASSTGSTRSTVLGRCRIQVGRPKVRPRISASRTVKLISGRCSRLASRTCRTRERQNNCCRRCASESLRLRRNQSATRRSAPGVLRKHAGEKCKSPGVQTGASAEGIRIYPDRLRPACGTRDGQEGSAPRKACSGVAEEPAHQSSGATSGAAIPDTTRRSAPSVTLIVPPSPTVPSRMRIDAGSPISR